MSTTNSSNSEQRVKLPSIPASLFQAGSFFNKSLSEAFTCFKCSISFSTRLDLDAHLQMNNFNQEDCIVRIKLENSGYSKIPESNASCETLPSLNNSGIIPTFNA